MSLWPSRWRPDLWAYVLLTVLVLWNIADRFAPYHGVEAGCQIGYVYDGDTIEMICGGVKTTARLQGFDAPETKEPRCAAEAEWGHRATLRLRELVRKPEIRLYRQGFDKYGRDLVVMTIGTENLADIMVAEGLAVAYSGGKRRNWCAG